MNLSVAVGKSDHVQGAGDAPVTLLEYGDYQCPFCADMHPMIKAIAKSMGSQMRFVFRHMPLLEMHPYAQHAAEAAEAAAVQGKFWEMHDAIYRQQSELGSDLLHQLAVKLKLDIAQFDADSEARRFRPRVKRDFMSGMRSGVASTPAFFVNGKRYDGALDQASLLSAVGRA
jgi:protein-disulfide isomerase